MGHKPGQPAGKATKISIRLMKNGILVLSQGMRRRDVPSCRNRAYWLFETKPFDLAYIKVTYSFGDDYYNDGWYTTNEEAKRVLAAFTEADLIRELT